ncbi:hypothetical protein BESB_048540 [Besnoitia besnoiti]|uniref:Uncharacterized protein n=1 Tax=Besnoitia besnoiti TaxID=94643 RepID=A0A2A9MMB4_BESBE|nr:hypothetical protein BESB_048540 [Besnoitia besnoiti]PFH36662.1 hypothetical protein BESB_048540 [Besnoitia besnoiti]
MDFPQASSAAPAWSPLPSSPSGGAPRASSSPASSLSSSSALTPPRRVAKNPVREGAVALLVFDFFPDDAGEGWNVRVSSHMSARLPRVHPALSACPSSSKEGDVEAAGEEDGTEAGTRENASPGARPSPSGGASLHAREEEGGSASHDGERPRGVAEDRLSRGEECRGTEGGSTEASSPGGTTRRGRRKGGKDRRGDAVSSPRHEGEGRDVKITGEALERSERKPRLEDASRWILAPSVRVRTSQELAAAWAQGRWPASVSAASLTSSLHSNAEWDGAVQAGANASDTNAPKHLELGGLNDREPSDPCSPRPRLSTPPPAPASGGVCGAQHIAGASPFSVAVSASPHAFLSSSPRCASSFADAAWFRFPYAHDRRDSRAESARAGSRVSLWLAQYPLSVSFPPPPSESSLRSCPSPPAESLPVASLCTSPVAHAPGCLLLLGRDRVFPLNIVAEVSAQLPLRELPSLQGLRARLAAVPSMCFSSFGFGVPPPPLHSPGTAGPAGDLLASGSAATASACSLCGPPRGEKTPRARNARGGAGETPPNRGEATEAADVRETGEGGGPLAERADPSDYGLEAAPRQDARARRADDSAQDKREDELWREKALLVSSRLATGSLMAFRAAAAAAASASSATGAPSPPASRFAGTKRRRSKADEEGAGDGDGQGEDGAAVPAGCTRRAASRDRRADTRGARNGQVGCEAGNGKAAGDPREANEDSAHAHRANRDLETGGREEGGTRRKQEVSRQAASPETGEARGGDGSAATERGDEARPARAEPETAPVERERNVCLARGARDILARLWRRGDQKAVCAECVSSGAILGGSCPRHHVIRGLFAFERFTSLAQEEDAPGMATRRGMPFPALAARDHILELSFCLAGSGGLAGDEEAKDTEDRLGETGERRECCCCCGDARGAEAGTTAKSGSGRDGRNGDLSRGVERPVAALVSSFSSFRSAAPLLGARFHAACLMRLLSEFVKGEPSGDPREAKWKESRGGMGVEKADATRARGLAERKRENLSRGERIHQWVETCAGQATANKAPSMRHEKGRSDSSSVEEQRGCDAEENTASGRGEIAATAEKGTGSREESKRNDKQKTEIDRQRACGVKASAHRASDEAASENPDRREAAKEKTAKRGKEKKTTRGEGENGDAETREDLGPAGEPLEAKEKEPQDEETVGRQRASEARSGVQDLETGLLGSLRVLSLAGVGIPLPSACTPWLDAARSSRRKHGAAAHSSSILPSSPSPPSSSLRPSHASPPTPSLAVLPPPAVGSAGNVPPASASGPSVCPAQSASAASAPSAMTVGGYVGGGDRARWLSLLRACAASTVREWGLCEALDRLADSERRVPASASSGKKAETEREKRTREDRAPAAEDEPEGDASGDAESVTKRHMKERSREEGEDKACAQEEDDSEADEDCEEKADAGGEARPFLRLEIASATRMIARGLPPSAERNALLYRHRRGGEAEQEKARSGTLKLSGAL